MRSSSRGTSVARKKHFENRVGPAQSIFPMRPQDSLGSGGNLAFGCVPRGVILRSRGHLKLRDSRKTTHMEIHQNLAAP
uniref:Uncharacterized protein n=1 Tax=viral metagenome TaxID=1070528 RepID=A0A2V0RA26_9ZZZZ